MGRGAWVYAPLGERHLVCVEVMCGVVVCVRACVCGGRVLVVCIWALVCMCHPSHTPHTPPPKVSRWLCKLV